MSNTSYKHDSLLPRVYPQEEHALDIANGVRFEKLRSEMQTITTLANPYLCPVEFLPLLAYAFGADFYWEMNDLDEQQQRNLVAMSLKLHNQKGTKWAVEKVLEIINPEYSIWLEEWFEYEGDPYFFRAKFNLDGTPRDKTFGLKEFSRLKKYVWKYKNVRSLLEGFVAEIHAQSSITLTSGAVSRPILNKAIVFDVKASHIGVKFSTTQKPKLQNDVSLEAKQSEIMLTSESVNRPILNKAIVFDVKASHIGVKFSTTQKPKLQNDVSLEAKQSEIMLTSESVNRQILKNNHKQGVKNVNIEITGAVSWLV